MAGHYHKFQEQTASSFQGPVDVGASTSSRQQILDMLEEIKHDVMQVYDFGSKKHPDGETKPNFLEKNGSKCSLKDRGSSILRHGARTFMNPKLLDEESGLPELLHLLSSVNIMYIRAKRNIIHPDDEKTV